MQHIRAWRLAHAGSGGFDQTYQYNPFGDIVNRDNWFWSARDIFTANYINGRNQDSHWQYDTEGNLRFDKDLEYTYDASGENASVRQLVNNATVSQTVDADSEMMKRVQTAPGNNSTSYYLRSTVLDGKVLTELNALAQPVKQYAYFNGEVLATIEGAGFFWRHEVPVTGSRGVSNTTSAYAGTREPDSMGVDVGFEDPYNAPPEEPHDPDLASLYPGVEFGGKCRVEGIQFDCVFAQRMVNGSDIATRCPNDDCGVKTLIDAHGNLHLAPTGFDPETGRLGNYSWDPNYRRNQPDDDADVVRVNNRGKYIWNYADVAPQLPQNPSRKLNHDETSQILDDLLDLIHQNAGCEEGLNKFLGHLAKSTGFNAGTMTDIIARFRESGIVYLNDSETPALGSTGGGDAGTGKGGVPAISVTPGGTRQATLLSFMAEMTHWAGMRYEGKAEQAANNGYSNYYPDEVLAKVGADLGIVMSVEQYKHTYPQWVDIHKKMWGGRDMTESLLGHGAMEITCLHSNLSITPRDARP